ncbi:hypothetical protein WJX84_007993 [Apatococcus fuscideae]|uniref:Uncharacterized protein n=1 Tax=Apatococcus fuscideae TaxID=2026836 RepID=A0AAW1TDD3_9CHLO
MKAASPRNKGQPRPRPDEDWDFDEWEPAPIKLPPINTRTRSRSGTLEGFGSQSGQYSLLEPLLARLQSPPLIWKLIAGFLLLVILSISIWATGHLGGSFVDDDDELDRYSSRQATPVWERDSQLTLASSLGTGFDRLLGADQPGSANLDSSQLQGRPQTATTHLGQPIKTASQASLADDYAAQELWQTNAHAGAAGSSPGEEPDVDSGLTGSFANAKTSSQPSVLGKSPQASAVPGLLTGSTSPMASRFGVESTFGSTPGTAGDAASAGSKPIDASIWKQPGSSQSDRSSGAKGSVTLADQAGLIPGLSGERPTSLPAVSNSGNRRSDLSGLDLNSPRTSVSGNFFSQRLSSPATKKTAGNALSQRDAAADELSASRLGTLAGKQAGKRQDVDRLDMQSRSSTMYADDSVADSLYSAAGDPRLQPSSKRAADQQLMSASRSDASDIRHDASQSTQSQPAIPQRQYTPLVKTTSNISRTKQLDSGVQPDDLDDDDSPLMLSSARQTPQATLSQSADGRGSTLKQTMTGSSGGNKARTQPALQASQAGAGLHPASQPGALASEADYLDAYLDNSFQEGGKPQLQAAQQRLQGSKAGFNSQEEGILEQAARGSGSGSATPKRELYPGAQQQISGIHAKPMTKQAQASSAGQKVGLSSNAAWQQPLDDLDMDETTSSSRQVPASTSLKRSAQPSSVQAELLTHMEQRLSQLPAAQEAVEYELDSDVDMGSFRSGAGQLSGSGRPKARSNPVAPLRPSGTSNGNPTALLPSSSRPSYQDDLQDDYELADTTAGALLGPQQATKASQRAMDTDRGSELAREQPRGFEDPAADPMNSMHPNDSRRISGKEPMANSASASSKAAQPKRRFGAGVNPADLGLQQLSSSTEQPSRQAALPRSSSAGRQAVPGMDEELGTSPSSRQVVTRWPADDEGELGEEPPKIPASQVSKGLPGAATVKGNQASSASRASPASKATSKPDPSLTKPSNVMTAVTDATETVEPEAELSSMQPAEAAHVVPSVEVGATESLVPLEEGMHEPLKPVDAAAEAKADLTGSGADGGPDVPEQLPADQPQGDQLPLLLLDEPAPAGHAGADPADPHVPPHDPEAAAAAGTIINEDIALEDQPADPGQELPLSVNRRLLCIQGQCRRLL